MSKNSICLWYSTDAEAAARLYADTFPDSTVDSMFLVPVDYPGGERRRALTEALAAGGEEARRAFVAMMDMKKTDVSAIAAARRG